MNIRCSFCQTPYTLSRVQILDAMQEVDAAKLSHYDAHCPRCRRATKIPRLKLEMAMPNWKDELKAFEKEVKQHPQQEAPLPKPEAESVTAAAPAPEQAPVKKDTSKAKATTKPTTEGSPKPAARQTTPSAEPKKSAPKKPAAKTTAKKAK
jgi:hypothetical protein